MTIKKTCRSNRIARTGMIGLLAMASATLPAVAKERNAGNDLTIAIGGDLLGPYHSLAGIDDPGFAKIKTLLRTADSVVANQEGSIFDAEKYQFAPSAENNGLPLAPEIVARELRAAGIDLLSKANNHAVDWGLGGLEATEQALDRSAIAFAGSGASEEQARAAAYVTTSKGKVALVSLASTFQLMAQAANAGETSRGKTRPRPGISVLRLTTSMRLPAQAFGAIKAVGERYGAVKDGGVTLGSQQYVSGTAPGFSYAMDPRDEAPVLDAVSKAASVTPSTLVAIHAHETDNGDPDDPVPPNFLVKLAHEAIDHGAAAFIRHGPHAVGGIEIYRGHPIFYGVGSLYFDFGGRRSYTVPATGQVIRFPDSWFEGFLAMLTMRDGLPREVKLYPILLDDTATPKSGMPRLATGRDAARILSRVQRYSEPFGTRIAISHDIGIITMPAAPASTPRPGA